jgi:small subunit ribosomal protein S10
VPRSRAKSPTSAAPATLAGPVRLRIFLRSFDHRVVDQAAIRLTEIAERGGGRVEGPIPLPSRPAPIDGLRTHVRRLDLIDPGPTLLAQLRHLDLPTGVEIEMAG